MVVAKEYAWNEKVKWCEDCFSDDSSILFLEDITINKAQKIPNKKAGKVFELKPDEFLTEYVDIDRNAMESLLSGKDEHFKLERIVITANDEVKLYFDRKQKFYYSWNAIKSLKPSFTVVCAKRDGTIKKKTRIQLLNGKYIIARMYAC
ncbi:hypothetical protein IKG28_03080 [Candidatus Saccharibacteria bacterium]|nr:hypothetical protein [Candidatus Saccharibacteria bacterium]